MRVAVGKIEGVRSVKVSLKEGVATIQFAPANRVTLSRIRDAIRSNGFAARAAEVQVAGSLVQRGDTLTLVIPGTDDVLLLQDAPGATGLVAGLPRREPSAQVVLAGQLQGPKPGQARGLEWMLVRSLVAP